MIDSGPKPNKFCFVSVQSTKYTPTVEMTDAVLSPATFFELDQHQRLVRQRTLACRQRTDDEVMQQTTSSLSEGHSIL